MSGTNWSNPTITTPYATFLSELAARDVSAMTQMRSSLTADSNVPTKTVRFNDANFNWESWSGTAWGALAAIYGVNISGNAATATNATNAANSAQLGGVAPASYALLASPVFTGAPNLPTGAIGVTQTPANNSTKLATTAYADAGLALKANIADPTFTGLTTLQNTSAGGTALKLVGDGTVAPNKHLRVTGGVLQVVNSANATVIASITDAGDLTMVGNVTAYSDERVKTNVKNIENALDKVNSMRGVSFDRTDITAHQVGVIAQEIQRVLPEVVYEGQDGKLSVAYGNIVSVLIEAIKELSEKVRLLEAK